jgi:hypothetical protein
MLLLLYAKIRQQKQYSIACKTKPRYLFNNGVFMAFQPFLFLAGTVSFFEFRVLPLPVLVQPVLQLSLGY